MRVASFLYLVAVSGLMAGCGAESSGVAEQETTARADPAPERDLTLQARVAPAVEVTSPVELTRPLPPPARSHRSDVSPQPVPPPDPEPAHTREPLAPAPAVDASPAAPMETASGPAPVLPKVSSEPPAAPVADDAKAGAGRELAPGKTVTAIPVSSGPSIEADAGDSWLPSQRPRGIIGGGGGTCRPRGGVRGVGIAGRIPVGVPARRLR